MNEWISVESEMPSEADGQVLMCFQEPFFGSCTAEIECGYFDEGSEEWMFWLSDRPVVGPGVTHWMRLPEKPLQNKSTEEVICAIVDPE